MNQAKNQTEHSQEKKQVCLQKRREQARLRRIRKTSQERCIRLERRRQTDSAVAAKKAKQRYDREHYQQKRAQETTQEREQLIGSIIGRSWPKKQLRQKNSA